MLDPDDATAILLHHRLSDIGVLAARLAYPELAYARVLEVVCVMLLLADHPPVDVFDVLGEALRYVRDDLLGLDI